MHLDPELARQLVFFIFGGGLIKTIQSIVQVVRMIRRGMPIREQQQRLDIVQQKEAATSRADRLELRVALLNIDLHRAERYIAALRDVLTEHDIPVPERPTYY